MTSRTITLFRFIGIIFCSFFIATPIAHAKNKCPLDKTLQNNGEEVCAYDVVVHMADTTREGSIFELPTKVIIEIGTVIFGPVGTVAKKSFYREGGAYTLILTPSDKHKGYLRCANIRNMWSETGTRDYNNITITPEKGVYKWTLNKPALFGGGSWYKADFVWVSRHPSLTPNSDICHSMASKIINKLAASRTKKIITLPRCPEAYDKHGNYNGKECN